MCVQARVQLSILLDLERRSLPLVVQVTQMIRCEKPQHKSVGMRHDRTGTLVCQGEWSQQDCGESAVVVHSGGAKGVQLSRQGADAGQAKGCQP